MVSLHKSDHTSFDLHNAICNNDIHNGISAARIIFKYNIMNISLGLHNPRNYIVSCSVYRNEIMMERWVTVALMRRVS